MARTRWALAVLMAIQALLVFPLFRAGYPMGEDLSIHLAEVAHLSRALRAGDLGLWNPSANLGFPSGYYYQVLPQLVPALLHAVLGEWVPLLLLFKLAIAAPLVLLPLTTFHALRVCGVRAGESLGAAGAVGFVFSTSKWGIGADALFIEGLYTQAWGTLFFPLGLGYGFRYLRDGVALRRAVGGGLLTGLCHPFFGVALGPALLASGFWRRRPGALRRAALLLILLLLTSAFAWLPILIHYDFFGGFPAREPGEDGLAVGALLSLFIGGGLLDHGRVPLLTCWVALASVFAWRGDRVLAVLLAQAGVFGLLVVLGPYAGKTLDDLVPAIRFLGPMQLALAAAAGVSAVQLSTWAWGGISRPLGRVVLVLGGCIAMATLLVGSHRVMQQRLRMATDFSPVAFEDFESVMGALQGRPPGRLLADQLLGTGYHFWMYLPFVRGQIPALRAHGGAAMQSSSNYRFLLHYEPAAHSYLYGVRYVLVRRDLGLQWSGTEPLLRTPAHELLELPLGRYFAPVRIAGMLDGPRVERIDRTLEWLRSPGPESGEVLQIGHGAPVSLSGEGRVLSETEAPSRYAADVESRAPTAFLLRVTYHPGWSARMDDHPADVLRVTPDLMAIRVPPGRHHIEFSFRRPWWTWALLGLTLVVLLAASNAQRLKGALARREPERTRSCLSVSARRPGPRTTRST